MKTVLLGDICHFKNGLWKGKKPPYKTVKVLRNTNFRKDGVLDLSNIAEIDVETRQYEKRKLQLGDIILEKSGGGPKQPVGRVVLFKQPDGDYSFSNFTSVIRPKNKHEIFPKYLLRFLDFQYVSGATEKLQNQSTGIRNLRFDDYKKLVVPLPSYHEQMRLVKKLDEAFRKIDKAKANTEKNLKNTQELFESQLNRVFENNLSSWRIDKLKDVTTKIGSGATPRGGKSSYKTEGVSLIRSLNVYDDGFRVKNIAFIDDEQAKKLNNVALIEGDVLLNITGASVARCCVVPIEYLPARVNQHVSVIRTVKGILNPKFLHCLLISRNYKKKLLGIGEAAGTTRQAITKRQIQNFLVAFPTQISDQEKIVKKIDKLSAQTQKLQKLYQKKLENLEELRQSILKQAFEGKL